jgi:hypothetical protein
LNDVPERHLHHSGEDRGLFAFGKAAYLGVLPALGVTATDIGEAVPPWV